MKTKNFTRFMGVLAGSLLAVGTINAQETPHQRDSLMNLNKNAIQQITPGEGRAAGASGFWGYAFGDFAYMAKGDSAGRGTKEQYKGLGAHSTPTATPSAMEVRRAYLGYDYTINKHFAAYALLAYEGDEDVNDNRTVYLKYIYLKWKNIWKGSNLKIGQQATNSFASDYNTEPLLGYRAVEKTLLDMHGMDGSSDMGLMLDGRIWTYHGGDTSKVPTFIGYSAMMGDNAGNNPVPGFSAGVATSIATTNNTPASIGINPFNATTDAAKKFRGQLFVNCLNNALTVGVYADYINYGNEGFKNINPKSSTVLQQAVSTQKVYAVYNSKWFGIGGEFDMQSMKNGETEVYKNPTAGEVNDTTNAGQMGYSIFAHGTIIPNRLNVFARYDMYTPDTKYSHVSNETFTSYMGNVSNSGNGNSYKENFMNFGFDWTPTKDKKVHIMPNVWYYGIKNGYGSDNLASDNYLLYRLSFLFAFN